MAVYGPVRHQNNIIWTEASYTHTHTHTVIHTHTYNVYFVIEDIV
jgi:hypothetical protein